MINVRRHDRLSPTRAAATIPPGAGAAAMAAGVVSVGVELDGLHELSLAWLVVAALIWVGLAGIFFTRLLTDPARWRTEADTAPALTAVAATTVIGARISMLGWHDLALAALCLGAVAWLVLMPSVARHLRPPFAGVHFLICVATQGLAVLAASEAPALHARWLAVVAVLAFTAGLALYLVVLSRFMVTQIRDGAGDHWVFAGALAKSALAGAKILLALAALHWTPPWRSALRTADVVVLALALAAYLMLAVGEVRWPRPGYDVRRWSTAFPLGMTATALLSVAAATGIDGFRILGRVLIWPGVLVCVVLGVSAIVRLYRAAVTTPPANSTRRSQ